jgi:hypothetical protein
MDKRRWLPAPMDAFPTGETAAPRLRVLVARDSRLSTCDAMVRGLERAMEGCEIVEAFSVEGALSTAESSGPFDVCLVCLDLPPAPRGGSRLAEELMADGHAVVLITRSLRWLPAGDQALRSLPWVTPEADTRAVLEAIQTAIDTIDARDEPASADASHGVPPPPPRAPHPSWSAIDF